MINLTLYHNSKKICIENDSRIRCEPCCHNICKLCAEAIENDCPFICPVCNVDILSATEIVFIKDKQKLEHSDETKGKARRASQVGAAKEWIDSRKKNNENLACTFSFNLTDNADFDNYIKNFTNNSLVIFHRIDNCLKKS